MQLLLFKNSPQLLWISRKVHECEVIASSSFLHDKGFFIALQVLRRLQNVSHGDLFLPENWSGSELNLVCKLRISFAIYLDPWSPDASIK